MIKNDSANTREIELTLLNQNNYNKYDEDDQNSCCENPNLEKSIENLINDRVKEGSINSNLGNLLNEKIGISVDWEEPLVTQNIKSESYPLEDLPPLIKDAVKEVVNFVQCPVSIAANSALSAMSLAVQGRFDVSRANNLTSPISLYFLTMADSGERKTTCDNYFTKSIRDFENEKNIELKPKLNEYSAEKIAWELDLENAKKAHKQKNNIKNLHYDLAQILARKPKKPMITKLLHVDSTPEALAWSLTNDYPSAAMLSNEAGNIFGGHGMNKDSVMRFLSLLNILWDGGSQKIDRRSSESFVVEGVRFTIGLSLQLETLMHFIKSSKSLPRSIGFFARCLISWPESTQGERLFKESPKNWYALEAFNKRVKELLNIKLNLDENGNIQTILLFLSDEAKKIWIEFYNNIEKELKEGGNFSDIRDIASKAADNAVRLAAIFHVFQDNSTNKIDVNLMRNAINIINWHLNESKKLFYHIGLSKDNADILKLKEWLVRFCKKNDTKNFTKRDVQQFGPSFIRKKQDLIKMLDMLLDNKIIFKRSDTDESLFFINPKLFLGSSFS